MNLRKDFKKLAKSYKARSKKARRVYFKFQKLFSRYLRRQKITKTDAVMIGTLGLVILAVIGIIIQTSVQNIEAVDQLAQVKKAPIRVWVGGDRPLSNPGIDLPPKSIEGQNVAQAAGVETRVQVPILMYHRIDTELMSGERPNEGLTVPTENFESQLAYLKNNGYNVITLATLYDALFQGRALPARPVVISFDDGYADVYTNAFPLLKKYGDTGTFFVITNFFGVNQNYLTADQIKEMSAAGMDLESHTESHPNLADLPAGDLKAELIGSKDKLERLLGKKVNFLAYPYGSYNLAVLNEAKAAGYLLGLTIQPGTTQNSAQPFQLDRQDIGPKTNLNTFGRLLY